MLFQYLRLYRVNWRCQTWNINGKECVRRQSWPNLRYYPSTCVEGLWKTMKTSVRIDGLRSVIWTRELRTLNVYSETNIKIISRQTAELIFKARGKYSCHWAMKCWVSYLVFSPDTSCFLDIRFSRLSCYLKGGTPCFTTSLTNKRNEVGKREQFWSCELGWLVPWVHPFPSRNGWTKMNEWAVRHSIKKELCFAPFENKKSHKDANNDD
jgi:hypothetical protein